jgi:hypothetical protein
VCGVLCMIVSCAEGSSGVERRRRSDRLALLPLRGGLGEAVAVRRPVGRVQGTVRNGTCVNTFWCHTSARVMLVVRTTIRMRI